MTRCKVCKTEFVRRSMTHKACSPECAVTLAQQVRAKAEKRKDAETRVRLKTKSTLAAEAQTEVNRYCRLRDTLAGRGCITCGSRPAQTFGGAMDAGHWLSRGSHPHLRFNTYNIAMQCVRDNRYLGGAPLKFRAALIERIGLERVEKLEADNSTAKFDRAYLMRIKRVFSKKANRMGKRIEVQG